MFPFLLPTVVCIIFAADFTAAVATKILFIGNSFTHGAIEPTISFNKNAIRDANGKHYGGVPGIFKSLTEQAKLNFNVTIEAVSAQTFQFHYESRAQKVSGGAPWDVVVLQEYSTLPTPSQRGGKPDLFAKGAENIVNLVRKSSPRAKIYFYETWARPDKVHPKGAPYHGQKIQAMQTDLHKAYMQTASKRNATGVALVGDSFMKAIKNGVADVNPYNGIAKGKVNLWADDHYHASKYGSYLSACTIFATVTGRNPIAIVNGKGSTAAKLGVEASIATKLQKAVVRSTSQQKPMKANMIRKSM
ncbi:hypothetical protein BKA62DRAFT_702306 [Auriculariales sp. MPI-PUGE-AT-0066]|nr:hypothetical protein BKA62DRAFT_702306 [Auriculariales sp. MPI-PUGE-AT-0066]